MRLCNNSKRWRHSTLRCVAKNHKSGRSKAVKCELPEGSTPSHSPTNPKNMEQFLPLIEAIVAIVAFGSAAIIVETIISIIKTFKQ